MIYKAYFRKDSDKHILINVESITNYCYQIGNYTIRIDEKVHRISNGLIYSDAQGANFYIIDTNVFIDSKFYIDRFDLLVKDFLREKNLNELV